MRSVRGTELVRELLDFRGIGVKHVPKARREAGVSIPVGRSIERRCEASLVYRYEESRENVSGDGTQRGMTGKVICPTLSGSVAVDLGSMGR